MENNPLDDVTLQDLLTWIDLVPLSRPKRDLKRDFSDGVLVAEVIKFYVPSIVEIHNYTAALAVNKKLSNWSTLNRKVLSKLGCELTDDVMQSIAKCQSAAVERFLLVLKDKLEQHGHTKPAHLPHQQTTKRDLYDQHSMGDQDVRNEQWMTDQQQQQLLHPLLSSHERNHMNAPNVKFQPIGSDVISRYASQPPRQQTNGVDCGISSANSQLVAESHQLELQTRDENIRLLESKVKRLEQLLLLKDIRIEDLQLRVEQLESSSSSSSSRTGTNPPSRLPIRQARRAPHSNIC
jgi:hypothetical protein